MYLVTPSTRMGGEQRDVSLRCLISQPLSADGAQTEAHTEAPQSQHIDVGPSGCSRQQHRHLPTMHIAGIVPVDWTTAPSGACHPTRSSVWRTVRLDGPGLTQPSGGRQAGAAERRTYDKGEGGATTAEVATGLQATEKLAKDPRHEFECA